jgi:centromere protein C
VDINQDNLDSEQDSIDEDTGLRRGRRTRYRPLDWWRLERVEYGPGKGLAEIKKIITLPKPPVKTLGGRKRAGNGNTRKPPSSTQEKGEERVDKGKGKGKGKSREESEDIDPDVLEAARMERWNPEEGWDHDTKEKVVVWDYMKRTEESIRECSNFASDFVNLPHLC